MLAKTGFISCPFYLLQRYIGCAGMGQTENQLPSYCSTTLSNQKFCQKKHHENFSSFPFFSYLTCCSKYQLKKSTNTKRKQRTDKINFWLELPLESSSLKMQAVLRRIWSPNAQFSHQKFQAFLAKTLKTGDENRDNLRAISRKQHNLYRMSPFCEEISGKNNALYARLTYKCTRHSWQAHTKRGKISAQSHPILCIQFLNRENNDKNNTLPLGKQICFTIAWGCAEILPHYLCYCCTIIRLTDVTQISLTVTLGHIFVNRYTRIQPNVSLHFIWSCTCLVEDMLNSLNDCDILEKTYKFN